MYNNQSLQQNFDKVFNFGWTKLFLNHTNKNNDLERKNTMGWHIFKFTCATLVRNNVLIWTKDTNTVYDLVAGAKLHTKRTMFITLRWLIEEHNMAV